MGVKLEAGAAYTPIRKKLLKDGAEHIHFVTFSTNLGVFGNRDKTNEVIQRIIELFQQDGFEVLDCDVNSGVREGIMNHKNSAQFTLKIRYRYTR